MWMLQPPPIAHVMAGREKPNRYRSNSGSSRPSTRFGGDKQISRNVSQRTAGDKPKSGELLPAISLSRENSSRTANASPRTTSHKFDSSSSDDAPTRRKRRPPPIHTSEDSTRTVIHNDASRLGPIDRSREPSPRRRAQRRYLSPIMSDNASSDQILSRSRTNGASNHSTDTLSDDRRIKRRPALADKSRQDSSLNVLQELAPAHSLLNVQKLSKSPSFEARIELPPRDSAEDMELLGSGKAGFDSWYETREFAAFPQWAADRVRRDVSSRWSVDF